MSYSSQRAMHLATVTVTTARWLHDLQLTMQWTNSQNYWPAEHAINVSSLVHPPRQTYLITSSVLPPEMQNGRRRAARTSRFATLAISREMYASR